VAELVRQEGVRYPGVGTLARCAVEGRAALGAGDLDTACSVLEQFSMALSRRVTPSAGDTVMTSSGRTALPPGFAGRGRRLRWRGSTSCDVNPSRIRVAAMARAVLAVGPGAVSEGFNHHVLSAADKRERLRQFAAEGSAWQTATKFGDRSGAPGCASCEAIVEGPRVGLSARSASPARWRRRGNWPAVSEDFAEHWRPRRRPGMRPRHAATGIAAKAWADRRWSARPARMRLVSRRCAPPSPGASSASEQYRWTRSRTRDRMLHRRRVVEPAKIPRDGSFRYERSKATSYPGDGPRPEPPAAEELANMTPRPSSEHGLNALARKA